MIEEQTYRPVQFQPEPPQALRLAGWAFVAGSLAAFAYILLPPRLMESEWEFAAMMQMADNALLPLLGIVLVLHERKLHVTRRELAGYRILLALALGLGFFFLAIIPLAVTDSQRLEENLDRQLEIVDSNEASRMSKVETQLKKAITVQELRVLGIMLNLKPAPQEGAMGPAEQFEALRKRLREQMAFTHLEQTKQTRNQRIAGRARIEKDGLKIIVLALLASVFYLSLGFKNFGLFRPHCADPAG